MSVVLALLVMGLMVLAVAVVAGTEMRHRYEERRRARTADERRMRSAREQEMRASIRRVPR